MKKIPWLNEGLVGFFEYDVVVYGYQLVGRNKEQLQQEVAHLLLNQNYDRVNDKIYAIAEEEFFSLTPEEQFEINFPTMLRTRLNDIEYRATIKQTMLDSGEILPDDISIEDLDYNYREYTDEEVEELRTFVNNFPSVTQVELEDIYLRQNSENLPYLFQRSSTEASQINIQNYEESLEVSELICQLYEENCAIEEQLVANAEMIVDLYEKVNI